MDLTGKKLLILGANAETIPIVKKAQMLGVEVIVVDNICNSPAKSVADYFFDIDGKNVKKIVALIESNKVDGVLLGVADPLMDSYVEICDTLCLPCFVQKGAIEFFRNKNRFKELCIKNGLKVPREFFCSKQFEDVKKSDITYPIVVKPAQSRGGRGCSYCENEMELEEAFKKAQDNSDNKEVIGEEYIDSEDVVATFVFHNGKAQLLTLYDRLMLKSEDKLGTVTYEQKFPSKHTELFISQNQIVRFERLFDCLGMVNGIVNIQMFVHNGNFILYDPDGIINGGICNNVSEIVYDVDLLGGFVEFALGGEFSVKKERQTGGVPNIVATRIWVMLKDGEIGRIQGREKLEAKDYIVDFLWRLSEGDSVTKQMRYTEKATLARIIVIASSVEQLKERATEVRNVLQVYDTFGNNMIDLRSV